MTSQNHRNPSPIHPLVSLPQENLSLTFHFLHRSPVLCLAMPSPGTRAHTAHFGPGTPPTLCYTPSWLNPLLGGQSCWCRGQCVKVILEISNFLFSLPTPPLLLIPISPGLFREWVRPRKKRVCAVSTTSLGYEASEKSQAHGSLPF